MTRRRSHDGSGLEFVPLQPISLSDVRSLGDLLAAMEQTAFSGRKIGEAYRALLEMFQDTRCRVVLTISGAMTVAKQGLIICEMIDRGLVDAVITTGALLAHGLSESIGMTHYKWDGTTSDKELYSSGYNRIYDSIEREASLDEVERFVSAMLSEVEPDCGVWSSFQLCRELGSRLSQQAQFPGILRSAFEKGVPVYVPAFTDSELAFDVAIAAMRDSRRSSPNLTNDATYEDVFQAVPSFNPFLDLQHYARLIGSSDRLGIFTLGGGVPRNWAQQVSPYFELAANRLNVSLPKPVFSYGVRICPESEHWGGLSGSSYSEGVSWGKFLPKIDGGVYAEVPVDATIALPLLMKAVFEHLDGNSP